MCSLPRAYAVIYSIGECAFEVRVDNNEQIELVVYKDDLKGNLVLVHEQESENRNDHMRSYEVIRGHMRSHQKTK